jgi:GT2 family glycosyltransferase
MARQPPEALVNDVLRSEERGGGGIRNGVQPEISVIIVNLNTRELLDACLASVEPERATVSLEVIVIDNGSSDGSVRMVEEKYPAAMLVKNVRNEGFARPNNEGLRRSRGRFLLLLNSDTVVRPGAFRRMADFLEAHPDAGACGPRLIYPDGRLQYSAKGFPTVWTHFCDMTGLDRLFPASRLFGRGEMRYFDYEHEGTADHLMAAAFLVRRETYEQVGELDERFAIYYNDMDWCFRMVRAGWTIWYLPDAIVEHHLGKTVGAVNKRFTFFTMLYNNVMFFYQKHYGRWSIVAYRLLLAGGFAVRSAAWTVRALVRPTDAHRHMRTFAFKSLLFGLAFWRPAKIEEV